jgi:putative hemolysin
MLKNAIGDVEQTQSADGSRSEIEMFRNALLALLALVAAALAASCSPRTAVTNIANPASMYCEENGGRLEFRQGATGGVAGVCVLPDGSACDEWAYFRAECGPAASITLTPAVPAEPALNASGGFMPPGTAEEIADWWGVIKSTDPGAQYDDYFERQDLGQVIYFGVDSMDPAVRSEIEALRDSGRIVHLYGTLLSNVPDYNGSQIQVDRIEAGA